MKSIITTLLVLISIHLSYSQSDSTSIQFKCGVKDTEISSETKELMSIVPLLMDTHKFRKAATNDLYVCRLLIEIDSETYSKFGGDTTSIKEAVYRMINGVSKVYEEEVQTRLIVSKFKIYKTPSEDPYSNTKDVFNLLNALVNRAIYYNREEFDMAMYLPTKSFTGAGGVASSIFNVSPWGNLMTIAHELGHNFGSPHTQSCYWAGGPLDKCYAAEGDCYTGALESARGTIMSYCSDDFTFHPQVRALIYNYSTRNLRLATSPNHSTSFLMEQEFNKPYLIVKADVNATKYYYQVSTDVGFNQIIQEGLSDYNVLNAENLVKNTTYYIRLKLENALGQTTWSEYNMFKTADDIFAPKVQNFKELASSQNDRSNATIFNLSEVTGAKSYEIEFFDFSDRFERYASRFNFSSASSLIQILPNTFYQGANLIYRVRALSGVNKGQWSRFYPIGFLKDGGGYLTEHNGYLQQGNFTNTAITYFGSYDERNSNLKLIVSENQDLSNPVMIQNKEINKKGYAYNRPFMAANLKPNQNYYYQIQASRPKPDYLYNEPAGIWRTTSKFFTTGENKMPENTKMLSNASDSLIGEIIDRDLHLSNKYVYFVTEKGVTQVNQSSFKTSVLHPGNTNGRLSNRSIIGMDSNNNLVAITPVSSRSGGYDGAFPLQVFGFTRLKEEDLEAIEYSEFSFKESGEYLNNFYGNSLIVQSNLGLYSIKKGKLEVLPVNVENSLVREVRKEGDYLWISYYNSNSVCKILCFDKEYKLVTTLQTCNQSTLDLEGNLYYYHNSTYRVHKYSPKDGNEEILPDPVGVSKWGLFTNSYGDIYALGVNRMFKVFTLAEHQWNSLGDIFSLEYSNRQPKVDKSGRFWSNSRNFISVVNPCSSVPKPSLRRIIDNEKSQIVADGCQSTLWSWENQLEKKEAYLTKNNINLSIENPDIYSVYTAKCYDRGCTGEETSLILRGSYDIQLKKIDASAPLCIGTPVQLQVLSSNNLPKEAPYKLKIYNNKDSIEVAYSSLPTSLTIDFTGLQPGKYSGVIYSEGLIEIESSPIDLEIFDAPQLEISGKNIICKEIGSSNLALSISGGLEPYSISWFVNDTKVAETSNIYLAKNASDIYVVVKDHNQCSAKSQVVRIREINAPNTEIQLSTSTDMTKTLSVKSQTGQSYQWFLNNELINGGTGSSIIAERSGSYTVEISNEACSLTSNMLDVEIVLSKELHHSINVYPNPSQNFVGVETQVLKDSDIEIVDEVGKVVWYKKYNKTEKVIEKINISNWSAGKYIVSFKDSQESKTTKRFIKL